MPAIFKKKELDLSRIDVDNKKKSNVLYVVARASPKTIFDDISWVDIYGK